MELFVLTLANHRLHRIAFWYLTDMGPVLLLVVLVFLALPRFRRAAAACLLSCFAGAGLITVVFHYNYALAIWERHDDAIRFLDRSAFLAGFAASGLVYGFGLTIVSAARRLVRTP